MHCFNVKKLRESKTAIMQIESTSVVNNTFKKYSQYQCIYFMENVLAITIPINELQKYAILSPILFSYKVVNRPLSDAAYTLEDFGAF